MTLKDLELGQTATIEVVGGEGALRQHFLDMGVIPGAQITLIKYAPMGDPMELMLHGYELTLRLEDAGKITISKDNKNFNDITLQAEKSISDKDARDRDIKDIKSLKIKVIKRL